MFTRTHKLHLQNSLFLLGPRGSGKSTLIKTLFPPHEQQHLYIDLLNDELFDLYSRHPQDLKKEVMAHKHLKTVIIDEIQKIPRLLDVVHSLIEDKGPQFILTGSSARKIKRGAANLLAGRAFLYHLFPLTYQELGNTFKLEDILQYGSLPKIFQYQDPKDKEKFLRSYTLTYLKEEIVSEQITRKLGPFREFLEISAQVNGKIINASNIAKDVGVDTKTVQSYFQILEDTLVGFYLPSFHQSIRKSQKQKPKFYWFDIGVKRSLERTLDIPCVPKTSFYGETFEHFIILEFFRLNQYLEKDYRLSYFQTHDGAEIDLILSRPRRAPLLIEIKSSHRIDDKEVSTLAKLKKEFKSDQCYYLSQDKRKMKHEGVYCLHWQDGIEEIFNQA